MSKTALIIHGHFYQPPREDPATGVFPSQSSAKPFENWNEAVFRTCYEPNAFSRYLSYDGKVDCIYNNYRSISVNFGPTLLNWIEARHPEFSNKLKEADNESLKKTGHSNFIAQTYNHTILPLESRKNKKIQVQWALEEYRSIFRHESEGFWCAECAIDEETVDVLAEAGMKFVILSPWQAKSVNGQNLNGKPAPSDRPFIIRGKTKQLAAFFYNPDYASRISFAHLLRDADKLYSNILTFRQKNNNPELLTWATDGEIYGHHEAFGDMALAALVKKVEDGNDFYLTNYGAYLEEHPATEEAQLYLGEDGLGSSWSCSHGVKRWYTDCGCHTGGEENWNQKWRLPLRKALSHLEKAGRQIFDEQVRKILGQDTDTEQLLLNYGKVLTKQTTVSEYINDTANSCGKRLSENEIQTLATLLWCMKNIFFSFTSCGWFFNDISGIEPSQNIFYAVTAASKFERFSDENPVKHLLNELSEARSNVSGSGKTIAQTYMERFPAHIKSSTFFILNRLLAREQDFTDSYGFFRLVEFENNTLTVRNTETLETFSTVYETGKTRGNLYALVIKDDARTYTVDSTQTDSDMLSFISEWTDRKMNSCLTSDSLKNIFGNIKYSAVLASPLNYGISEHLLSENLSLCIKALKTAGCKNTEIQWKEMKHYIENLSLLISAVSSENNIKSLTEVFNRHFNLCAAGFAENRITDEQALQMLDILKIARQAKFNVDITQLQNGFWQFLNGNSGNISDETVIRLKEDLNFTL